MPELATGLTNLLILVSAVCCLLSLPDRREYRLWRRLFCLTALVAACGAAVHVLVLPEAAELILWALFDLSVCPLLLLLALAAREDVGPPLTPRPQGLLLAAALGCALNMIRLLLRQGFRAQFPSAAALGLAAAAVYVVSQWQGRTRPGGRSRCGLLAVTLLLLSGLTWLLGDFTVTLGPVQLTQAAWLHIGLAAALPLFRLSAGRGGPET